MHAGSGVKVLSISVLSSVNSVMTNAFNTLLFQLSGDEHRSQHEE